MLLLSNLEAHGNVITQSAILPIVLSLLVVINAILTCSDFALFARETRLPVSPEPEPMINKSPSLALGEVISPTSATSKPKCINLFAKADIAKPDLPLPHRNILLA